MILNAMQHNLTPDQLQELATRFPGEEIVSLATEQPELFAALAQCPKETVATAKLAFQFWKIFRSWTGEPFPYSRVILPIGSPKLQMQLGRLIGYHVDGREGYMESLSGYCCPPLLYAETARVSEDLPQADGSVRKVTVFKHLGFEEV